MKIVVTGADGFIGKNLVSHLKIDDKFQVETITRNDNIDSIELKLHNADVVFHLAGVNRPKSETEFKEINYNLTTQIVSLLEAQNRSYKLVLSSSTQAVLDNPYGISKRNAEEFILKNVHNGAAYIYRLPGVFGKWCKPNYNSVVSTFCFNVANNLPLHVADPEHTLQLVYIDDVVHSFFGDISKTTEKGMVHFCSIDNPFSIKLGYLAYKIQGFKESRSNLILPEIGDKLTKYLYSTYLSFLNENDFAYTLQLKTDTRGTLFELIKSNSMGQIFISTTKPGITRGNHYHHTKTEKFCVINGKAKINFKKIIGGEIISYIVDGYSPTVVDIPPGYTHNITNIGDEDLVTLFWANEIYDQTRPDTNFLKVD